ncbi:13331_t:CDS:2 [Gigaspora margarita]|uniref:13331_t:CDS:1 n=1 Tax=Gigaspora margarita TaxID=4874 RepID=A0ABN7W1K8_GIGMA|nr:13331_t:CDS:2 [Gigaspora margarita]
MNINNTDSFLCSFCDDKEFKASKYITKDGWSRHETYKHFNYNTPSKNLSILSDTHLSEIKNVLVYLIQSRLKLHMKHSGQQTVLAPLTESEFVSIFQNHIKRYSICHQKYICRFGGYDAYSTLTNIFNQENWGRRIYEHGQRSKVVLVSEVTNSQLNSEMIIVWKKHIINDEDGNKSEAGWVTLKFLVGQFY